MSFLDKVGSVAKTAADKAGETIEVTKLNVKINGQKDAIAKIQKNLGEYCYTKLMNGELQDDGAMEYCAQIQDCEREIEALQMQIQEVKES